MRAFYVRLGPHVVEFGVCQPETEHLVACPSGGEVVFEPPPEQAMQAPPQPGALWNLETQRWDAPQEPSVQPQARWAQVRAKRDHLLAACDWIVTRAQERGEPVPPQWLAYRQALRDITEQPDPERIQWPVAPEV